MKAKITARITALVLVLINVCFDQVTKAIARNELEYYKQVPVIKGYLVLVKVENSGAFLSAGDGLPEPVKFVLLNLLPVVIMVYGIFFLMTKTNVDKLVSIGVACVIGGGIGNIYDRMQYGSVTDFLHIDLGFYRTGVFNIADLSIVSGILMLLYYNITRKRRIATL